MRGLTCLTGSAQAWYVSFKLLAQRKLDLCRVHARSEKELLVRSRSLLQEVSKVSPHEP